MLIIEKALPEDAQAVLELLKIVGGETENLSFGGEGVVFTVEEERAYLAALQASSSAVMLTAKLDGEVVGVASFCGLSGERMKHRGELSVSVKKAAWGRGIGSRLVEGILDFAKNTAQAEIVSLEVRSDNARAIRLYEKYGFEKAGTFPGFFKIGDTYIDFDFMTLRL